MFSLTQVPRPSFGRDTPKTTMAWMGLVAIALGAGIGAVVVKGGLSLGIAVAAVAVMALYVVPVRWLLWVWPLSLVFWTPLFDIQGYNVTLTDMLTIFLWVRALGQLVTTRSETEPRSARAKRLLLIALLPVVPLAVGGVLSMGILGGVKSFVLFMKRWGIYTILPVALTTERTPSATQLRWSYLIASGVALGVTLLNHDTSIDARASGLLFNPNVLGIFAVLGTNVVAAQWRGTHGLWRWLLGGLLLIHLGAIAASGSREGWVGLGVSFVYWSFQPSQWRQLVLAAVSIAVVMLSPLGQVSQDRLSQVVTQGTGESNVAARLDAGQVGLKLFLDHPLGVGAGNIGIAGRNYLALYGKYDYDLLTLQVGLTTTDNTYLDTLIEGGLVAFVVLLWCLRTLWRNTARESAARGALSSLMVCGLAAAVFNVPVLSGAAWFIVALDIRSSLGGSDSDRHQDSGGYLL